MSKLESPEELCRIIHDIGTLADTSDLIRRHERQVAQIAIDAIRQADVHRYDQSVVTIAVRAAYLAAGIDVERVG